MRYNPQKIEPRWQKYWQEKGFYRAEDFSKKPKYYVLVEFPYPSGDGLHVGHARSYSALDVLARKRRMEGYNILFPMGWDAFGLPTENYAIKTGVHPRVATEKNIVRFKKQIMRLGLSFDWSREINTTDPQYYKWTQWIFLQLFKKGLAYEAEMSINWCPSCKIGLANEEVVEGKCERCGAVTGKKTLKQWMLKITKYAERLLQDLEKVDYPERVKTQQINWIGRSEGGEIQFKIQNSKLTIPVFTTRPDTLFGATYMVLAPEHLLIQKLKDQISNFEEVADYIKQAEQKSDLERTDLAKEKTGVALQGIQAINPVNNQEIPIWVSDYVLIGYGTGAIMAVPAHDERDFEFAKKFDIPIIEVISPDGKAHELKEAYIGEGVLINSDKFNGMKSQEAIDKITGWLAEKGGAKKAVNYKLRDWVFSRQHYWGEPIPLVFCNACKKRVENSKSSSFVKASEDKQIPNSKNEEVFSEGELLNPGWIAIPEKDLPLELPYVEKYEPTGTGESPLANVLEWVNTKCPKCGGEARRETDTMPNWAGSSWYFMRYIDPVNDKAFADFKKLKYWMPVDWYNGGMEHTTLHLLYSRFWHKFLFDIGVAPGEEPYQKRSSHGVVLGEDGRKMSKSFGNVINPDDVVKQYGADTLRMYEMFMGPMEEMKAWDTKGIVGIYRFLGRAWALVSKLKTKNEKGKTTIKNSKPDDNLERLRNKTIKKVTEDIEGFRFNTAISAMMEYINQMQNAKYKMQKDVETLLLLLTPFAPHIAEELWQSVLGYKDSIHLQEWPRYDPKSIREEAFELVIQINGKVRDKIEVEVGTTEEKAKELVLASEKIKNWIQDKEIKKIVFVPNKLINIVV